MLLFLFCIFFHDFVPSLGDEIGGDFRLDFCDEFGSFCSEKNMKKNVAWVRFQSVGKSDHAYWLKIMREEPQAYSVLIKSAGRVSRNISDKTQSMDCHFIAATHLMITPPPSEPHRQGPTFGGDISGAGSFPISLCAGISGIVPEPTGTHLIRIESVSGDLPSLVRLTSIPKLPMDHMVEMKGIHQHFREAADGVSKQMLKRAKRSFHMPVQGMPGPFLVELYLIVDSKMVGMYQQHDYSKLLSRIRSIMNQINLAFMQFNVYFTVVQLEIWEYDQFKITDENHILNELQLYKRQYVYKRHDCLHAILGENLGSARRGQSEPASMCAYNRCVGYTKDYWGLSELEIAHSVVHELGHNFGLSHDTERCLCIGCIMATGVEFGNHKFQWSNCSLNQMPSLLNSGMGDCLRDKPPADLGNIKPIVMSQNKISKNLREISTSQCGNGVVDDGEQCDCGGRVHCSLAANKCCNPDTCRFRFRAYCASGACCDLRDCVIRSAGTVCRSVGIRSCDLPEYCDGVSEWCPADVYKADGEKCTTPHIGDSSHCYHGECQSRRSWCRVLFGDTSEEASRRCYGMNKVGDDVKNCGLEIPVRDDRYSRPSKWINKPCRENNMMCGRLWCSHENERVLRSSHQLVVDEVVGGFHCSAARFYLDWFLDDAGIVPNGSPCGYGKMCWRGVCIHSISSDMGGCYCHGHGVCNNRGNCHCDPGFSAPNCTSKGDGGSIDSGPSVKFHKQWTVIVSSVLVSVIVLIMVLVIITIIYHYNTRRWPKFISKIPWPQYKMRDESKEPEKFENNYSKFNVSPKALLKLKHDINNGSKIDDPNHVDQAPPYASSMDHKSRTKMLLLPVPVHNNNSPTVNTVKSKASIFDKGPEKVSSKAQMPLLQPPILSSKPSQVSNVSNLKSQLNIPINSAQNKPPIFGSKPNAFFEGTVKSEKSQVTQPTQKSPVEPATQKPKVALATLKPPVALATLKPPVALATLKPPVQPATQKPPVEPATQKPPVEPATQKPPVASTWQKPKAVPKSQKQLLVPMAQKSPVGSSTQKPNVDPESRMPLIAHAEEKPVVLCDKPQKPLIQDKSVPVTSPKDRIQHSNKQPSTTNGTKAQISQPRLEQTTCTATTRELATTDQTLRRTVSPHKVLRVDSHKAVKYLY